jgi:hypothetical protein
VKIIAPRLDLSYQKGSLGYRGAHVDGVRSGGRLYYFVYASGGREGMIALMLVAISGCMAKALAISARTVEARAR